MKNDKSWKQLRGEKKEDKFDWYEFGLRVYWFLAAVFVACLVAERLGRKHEAITVQPQRSQQNWESYNPNDQTQFHRKGGREI